MKASLSMKKDNSKQHCFVILAHKDSPYLERCIESLLEQTVKSSILVSTATPSPYIEKISKRYRIPIVVSPGGGIGCDWNFAYRVCKTRYLTLAHQDDVYLPKYAEECFRSIRKDTLIVFTGYKEINKYDDICMDNLNMKVKRLTLVLLKAFKNTTSNSYVKKMLFSFCNPIACPSVFYDRENIKNFLFNEKLRFTLDWEGWIRLAKRKGSFSCVQNILMYHRIHEESETSLQTSNNNRIVEEREIFGSLWPGYLAKMFSYLYHYNSQSNIIRK